MRNRRLVRGHGAVDIKTTTPTSLTLRDSHSATIATRDIPSDLEQTRDKKQGDRLCDEHRRLPCTDGAADALK